MATLTAQILIGSSHPYDGGINPTHSLFLSENSKPAWVLKDLADKTGLAKGCVWIPTLENMLEDAFLMIGIQVLKDEELAALAESFCRKPLSHDLMFYEDFEEGQRTQLYEKCRQLKSFPKLVISAFNNSSITRQLPVIEKYGFEVDVCRSVFERYISAMTGEVKRTGLLETPF